MFFNFSLDHIINPATFHPYRELFNLGFFRMFIYSSSQPYKITSFLQIIGKMVPAQCFVHDLIRFVSSLSSGSFPPLFVSSSPLLRLLSSPPAPFLRLLSSSVLLFSSPHLLLSFSPSIFLLSLSSSPPLHRLLFSSPPAPFILSSCLLVLISSSSPVLLLFSPPLLRLLSSFHPGPLLFSGSPPLLRLLSSCPPLFLFLLIPSSHRCSIQPSLSIYSHFFSHL